MAFIDKLQKDSPIKSDDRSFGDMLRLAEKTPLRAATLAEMAKDTDQISDAEFDKINRANALETGMAAHLLLRNLGFDHQNTTMGVLVQTYGLAKAYQEITFEGKPFVADEKAAEAMATATFEKLDLDAKKAADSIRAKSSAKTPNN